MIVSCSPERIDVATAKLRIIFRAELEDCSLTGTLDVQVWTAVEEFKAEAGTDITAVESKNSVITRITNFAPNIDLQLVASRLTVRSDIIFHCAKKSLFPSLYLALGAYKHPEYKAIMDCPGRWRREFDSSTWLALPSHAALADGG